jgi:hypothetical protein
VRARHEPLWRDAARIIKKLGHGALLPWNLERDRDAIQRARHKRNPIGWRVRRFAPGDAVYSYNFANPKGGIYAEYVAVDAENVGRPPDRLSLREAGAITAKGAHGAARCSSTRRPARTHVFGKIVLRVSRA